jgi:hypothetical protein
VAPPAPAVTLTDAEQAALKIYAEKLQKVELYLTNNEGKSEGASDGMKKTEELHKMVQECKTAGLPKEIETTHQAFEDALKSILNSVAESPVPPEYFSDQAKLRAYVREQNAKNPGFDKKYMAWQLKIGEASRKLSPAQQNLRTVHEKYGLKADLGLQKKNAPTGQPDPKMPKTSPGAPVAPKTEKKPAGP